MSCAWHFDPALTGKLSSQVGRQAATRLRGSPSSAVCTVAGGYRGTHESEAIRKRALRGSCSAVASSRRCAMTRSGVAHRACAKDRSGSRVQG